MARRATAAGTSTTRRRPATADANTAGTAPLDAAQPGRLLGLPLGCALLVGVLAFAVYQRTLAPTVTFVDSGELIVAAQGLGVPHPPGFPVWALLAHAATWLPVGSVATRIHLLSAVCAAVAAGLVALLVAMLAGGPIPSARKPAAPAEGWQQGLRAVPLLAAGILFAFSRTLWSYATVAEVYTLNTALLAGALLCLLIWRRGRHAGGEAASDAGLYGAAWLVGLALGVHHVSTVLTAPGLVALVIATVPPRGLGLRRVALCAGAALAGIAAYAYLPLAASQSPLLNWGDPRTLERLWWHVTGRQYHSYLSFSAAEAGQEAAAFAVRAVREVGPWAVGPALLLMGIGALDLARRDRPVAVALLLIPAFTLSYALAYGIAEDKEAYYLPAFLVAALLTGVGAARTLQRAGTGGRSATAAALAAGVLALVPATLGANWRGADRSDYRLARDYVDNVLSAVAPHGMVLTFDWQLWAPWLYTRVIDDVRPDVTMIDVNLLRRPWYLELLRRQSPALVDAAQPEVDAFLEDLVAWEHDPARYARDPALTQRISARFVDLVMAFARHQLAAGPLYVTQDVVLSANPQAREVGQALSARYALVPRGLVFEVTPDRALQALPPLRWQLRGLADAAVTLDASDVVRVKVIPVYVSMLYNRGRYLAMQGDRAGAAEAYDAALALDPSFAPARTARQAMHPDR